MVSVTVSVALRGVTLKSVTLTGAVRNAALQGAAICAKAVVMVTVTALATRRVLKLSAVGAGKAATVDGADVTVAVTTLAGMPPVLTRVNGALKNAAQVSAALMNEAPRLVLTREGAGAMALVTAMATATEAAAQATGVITLATVGATLVTMVATAGATAVTVVVTTAAIVTLISTGH
jgi:hypothetical protein